MAARIEETLGDRCDAPATQAATACIDAANELLSELLARPSAGRESALDLLTVDALVTYAFEAAAAEPDTLAARASDAMGRFSASVRL
jgi:hypothetical protein